MSGRYREPTLIAYTQDLKAFLGWCHTYDRQALQITRGELEMYVPLPRESRVRRSHHRSAVRHGRNVLQVRGDRRGHPGQPGRGRDPAEGGVGGAEAHGAAPAGVRCPARRGPTLGAE
jgi:hypothetical protein